MTIFQFEDEENTYGVYDIDIDRDLLVSILGRYIREHEQDYNFINKARAHGIKFTPKKINIERVRF